MPELIDKKRTEAKVFLIARFFIDRPDREVELVKAVIHRCCEEIDKQPTIDAEPVRHGRWIPVEDALPEEDVSVLCYMRIGEIVVMEYGGDGWYCGVTRYNPRAVTHWMYLPEPPKEAENE